MSVLVNSDNTPPPCWVTVTKEEFEEGLSLGCYCRIKNMQFQVYVSQEAPE